MQQQNTQIYNKKCLEMMTGALPPPPPLCSDHPQNNQPSKKFNEFFKNFFRV